MALGKDKLLGPEIIAARPKALVDKSLTGTIICSKTVSRPYQFSCHGIISCLCKEYFKKRRAVAFIDFPLAAEGKSSIRVFRKGSIIFSIEGITIFNAACICCRDGFIFSRHGIDIFQKALIFPGNTAAIWSLARRIGVCYDAFFRIKADKSADGRLSFDLAFISILSKDGTKDLINPSGIHASDAADIGAVFCLDGSRIVGCRHASRILSDEAANIFTSPFGHFARIHLVVPIFVMPRTSFNDAVIVYLILIVSIGGIAASRNGATIFTDQATDVFKTDNLRIHAIYKGRFPNVRRIFSKNTARCPGMGAACDNRIIDEAGVCHIAVIYRKDTAGSALEGLYRACIGSVDIRKAVFIDTCHAADIVGTDHIAPIPRQVKEGTFIVAHNTAYISGSFSCHISQVRCISNGAFLFIDACYTAKVLGCFAIFQSVFIDAEGNVVMGIFNIARIFPGNTTYSTPSTTPSLRVRLTSVSTIRPAF